MSFFGAFSAPARRWPAHRWLAAACVVWLSWLPCLAAAQDDPPGRVGRLAQVEGAVWVYDVDADEWILASRNRPLTRGDRLSTEDAARAQVRIGSTTLRLDGRTEVEFVRLDDEAMHVQLHSGSASARTLSDETAREFMLSTDVGRFKPLGPGLLRVDHADDTSTAAALAGTLRFESDDSVLDIEPGRRAAFWRDGRTHYTWRDMLQDDFARWVDDAERRDASQSQPRHVSPEMTGAEDLEGHGRWIEDADYGALWIPRVVVPGWAPYRFGHWAWIGPWGWTWVDDAPWGFAPFHYGRWVWYRGAWGWAPGAYVRRPVYAPALVAWVGGPHVGVSVTLGRNAPPVGWFPLAPREVYVPTYRVSAVYVRNVNRTHAAHVDAALVATPGYAARVNRYANRRVVGAVTVVPADVIVRRRPVASAAWRADDPRIRGDLHRAPVRVEVPVPARSVSPGPRRAAPPAVRMPAPDARPGVSTPPIRFDRDRGERRDRRDDSRRAPGPSRAAPPGLQPRPQQSAPVRERSAERREQRMPLTRAAPQRSPSTGVAPVAPAPAPAAAARKPLPASPRERATPPGRVLQPAAPELQPAAPQLHPVQPQGRRRGDGEGSRGDAARGPRPQSPDGQRGREPAPMQR